MKSRFLIPLGALLALGFGISLLVYFRAALAAEPVAKEKPAAQANGIPAPPPVSTAPVPVAEAAGKMTVPPGFSVSLVAGEPDVVQPIAFTFDDRGRLWVCECLSYPKYAPTGEDRITIFDNDGHGHFAKKKVFWAKGNYLTGIALGHGGVYVCCAPNILFIPANIDADDPTPTGEPQAVLDGWSTTGKHNVVNDLTWGPDGWLWGCNGITAPSKVGVPGTAAKDRLDISCGVWRYQPITKQFEVVAHGTTNPFGLDFDEYGQAFITNCVIGHLFNVIPGAHFQRMFGADYNPYVYDLIAPCSDHLHWGGGSWTTSRGGQGAHSEAGGGHAHCGAMIYLGDALPASYRNTIFMCNIHGNRLNNDILAAKGSGYVGHHGKDFLFANDSWFRGVAVHQGPDGAIYVADWSDTGECHNYDRIDRLTGRLYRVTYDAAKVPPLPNLLSATPDQLVEMQTSSNDWLVRHARRRWEENRQSSIGMEKSLIARFDAAAAVPQKLRLMWALHSIPAWSQNDWLLTQTKNEEPEVRQWAVRFLVEDKQPSKETLAALLRLATEDKSPAVRLEIASGLQRIPLDERWDILAALLAHGEDVGDQNLPLMDWYALEPLVPGNTQKVLKLAAQSKIPLVREFIARRIAGEKTKETKGN
ncbi:MAG TPA: PVC-type heme-binding CxxCH protein [Pirellulales bacterium]|jgi:putative membrane-bound dehydrogenase-like protein|nr:PVC-type heme-binding CxxCH protein [Pirellulales bacterium]